MKIIFSHSTTPSFNLAAEEYLFSKTDENFLFLYANEPSVIIGSNQAVVNEVDMDFCIDNEILIIRRMSGGGAVYHDLGNLNYTFIKEKDEHAMGPAFLNPIVTVLNEFNIPAEIGKRKDLWLKEYKISGTAAHISRGRQLHHGTLLYDSELNALRQTLSPERRDLIKRATASVPSPVRNIRDYLLEQNGSAPYKDDFFDHFVLKMLIYYNLPSLTSFSNDDIEAITELQKSKYTQRDWNYRK